MGVLSLLDCLGGFDHGGIFPAYLRVLVSSGTVCCRCRYLHTVRI